MEEQKETGAPAAPPAKGKGLWIGIVVVVIVIVILLAAVFAGLFGAPPTATPERVLKIGTILTLTGTSGLEVFGPANQKGALLAVEEINAAGGVLGNPIQVVNEDDVGKDAGAADRARKLITSDDVDAILGAVGSGKCAAAAAVAGASEVIQISASCTSPIFSNPVGYGDLSAGTRWFVRTAPSDALQGVVAANYASADRLFTTMGVIGNNNPYGSGLANVFKQEFESLGGSANVAIFAEGSTSYASDLDALITGTPGIEAIYMANYPTDGLQVMRDWWANPDPAWRAIQWIFSEGVLDQKGYVDLLVAAGIDTNPFEGSAPGAYLGVVGDLYDEFLDRFQDRYGNFSDPGLFTANAYDAIYLLAAAAEAAGSATSEGIQGKIRDVATPGGTVVSGGEWARIRAEIAAGRDIDYAGASGAVNLDQFGDPLSGYGIWGINDATKKIETLKLYDEAAVVDFVENAPPLGYVARSPVAQPGDWMAPVRFD